MDVCPVPGERLLLLSAGKRKVLVAADLHVGIEEDFHRRGFHIPDQTGHIIERLSAALRETGAGELVLLGDVKHRICFARENERLKVRRLVSEASRRARVTIVLGNHDAGLRQMVPDGTQFVKELQIGNCGLCHGHTWPSEMLMACRTLVVAHTHPSVLLRDERGRRLIEPCWLRTSFWKCARAHYRPPFPVLVVMPALCELRAGVAVNEKGARLLGPVFRNGLADIRNANVHLTDGTYLGKLSDLEVDR